MSLSAFWTPEAEASFVAISDYLEKEWGPRVADAFASDVVQTIALLEEFPLGGVVEVPELGIRSIPVVRQVRLFYAVKVEALLVLEFIDTRGARFQGLRV
jgi:plasmid stabilization system protein ParE